jgi:hypothetical protein
LAAREGADGPRVRIDAPLRIEDAWQDLGEPQPAPSSVTWAAEGATWEARWERAERSWRVETEERPLLLRAQVQGRVTAYSDETLDEQVAQPWLAKTFAENELPLPEFTDWQPGTRRAC